MTTALQTMLETMMGWKIQQVDLINQGLTQLYKITTLEGNFVLKMPLRDDHDLIIEARMLHYLKAHSQLPVPQILMETSDILLLSFHQGSHFFSPTVEREIAHQLARLHSIRADAYGLPFDTLIGALPQPNTQASSWIEFFSQYRLCYMAKIAFDAGQLPRPMLQQIEHLSSRLNSFLDEPPYPALIHGDLWSGNVLATYDTATAFIDPAIYYADHEIELAFINLFHTFGDAFWNPYQDLKPIRPEFFEVRQHIYNLYPLLVHVTLFGGSYLSKVAHILQRFAR